MDGAAQTARPLSDKARLLSRTPLFGSLRAQELETLASRTAERTMRAGEVVFRRSDPGTSMVAILSGEVRIVLPGAGGRDQVLRILRAGEVFGEVALLDGRPRTADVVAETNGRLMLVERRDLLHILQDDPGFALRIITLLCDRLRANNGLLEAMLFQDAAARLASTLLTLAAGRPGMRVDITQRALGEMVGAARETVNKKLREWQAASLLALRPGRVTVLDPEGLRHYAVGAEQREQAIPGKLLGET